MLLKTHKNRFENFSINYRFSSFLGVHEGTLHFQTLSNVLPIHFFGEFISFDLVIQGPLKKLCHNNYCFFIQNCNLIPFSET
jgi:hypothetical protein